MSNFSSNTSFDTHRKFQTLLNQPRRANSIPEVATGVEWNNRAVRLCIPNSEVTGIAIPLRQNEMQGTLHSITTAGIEISRKVLTFATGKENYLFVECRRLEKLRTFSVFAEDLLNKLYVEDFEATDELDTQDLVVELFREHKNMFSDEPGKRFSEEEEIGLLCELEVLKHLVETKRDPIVLNSWTGPSRTRHDFTFDEYSIECKATRSANGLHVSIHGSEQLDPDTGKKLFLVARRYRSNKQGLLSVPDLIEELENNPYIDCQKLREIITATDCGYYDSSANSTKPQFGRWSALDAAEFEVVEDFPRLAAPENFHRVQKIQYVLDLSNPGEVPGYQEQLSFLPNDKGDNRG